MAYCIQQRRISPTPKVSPRWPGHQWHLRYLARFPSLKTTYSRTLDQDRAYTNNPSLISEFLNLFKEVVSEYNILRVNTYNMDETGIQLGQATGAKVIVPARCKYQFVTQDGNRENVIVVEYIGASGTVLPPLVIFKGTYHQ